MKHPKMCIFRIARVVDGVFQTVVFVGTKETIPAGWSYHFRRVITKGEAA